MKNPVRSALLLATGCLVTLAATNMPAHFAEARHAPDHATIAWSHLWKMGDSAWSVDIEVRAGSHNTGRLALYTTDRTATLFDDDTGASITPDVSGNAHIPALHHGAWHVYTYVTYARRAGMEIDLYSGSRHWSPIDSLTING